MHAVTSFDDGPDPVRDSYRDHQFQGPDQHTITGAGAPAGRPALRADTGPATRRDARTSVLDLAGIRITRIAHSTLIASVRDRLAGRHRGALPLAIGSVNLDHVYHFGVRPTATRDRGPASGHLGHAGHAGHAGRDHRRSGGVEWQLLVDGAPISRHARAVTGQAWPRLAGSDLLPDMLDVASATGARVGFLGGSASTARALKTRLRHDWPALRLVEVWTPPRSVLEDAHSAGALADQIRAAGVDLLVVGLGKPRQELWTDEYGDRAGATVIAMFGAAADFLAGASRRAPSWMRRAGIEWVFRLVTEPRRLWRRYLVQGPRAMRALRRGGVAAVYPPADAPAPLGAPVTAAVTAAVTSSAARPRGLAS